MTFRLEPGGMMPLDYRIDCADFAEQERVLPRVEMAWRILRELARELPA